MKSRNPALALPPTLVLVLVLALCACSSDGDAGGTDSGTRPSDSGGTDAGTGTGLPSSIGPEERPARVIWPTGWDATTPAPLVVLLHGFTASATVQDAYWQLSRHSRRNGYVLLLPDGTMDADGNRFWSATPACCDLYRSGVDDEGYLRALVHEMKSRFAIDPGRVYFTGHSNGGFMSFRMACAMAGEVTAIASLAGATFATEAECGATEPVSVLQVHGTLDGSVDYDGNALYPSAPVAVERWATRAGCDVTMPTTLAPLDLDVDLPGAETTVARYETGCTAGLDAELWTIVDGSHIPSFHDTWAPTLVEWLFRHEKSPASGP
jgi:polyhydroxybutyrate depolymerase